MKNIIRVIFTFTLVAACESSEFELEKSIFVPDDVFESLPAYTEWGYNTFGAFYERKLFTYNNSEVPAKVIHTDNLARFILKGSLKESSSYGGYYDDYYPYSMNMTLSFDLPGFHPETYGELTELDNVTFDLTDPLLNVTAIIGADTIEMDVFNGELFFKKAQHLSVDQVPINVILSGYFGFQALVQGAPVSISHGRFDVSIDEYDFARY